VTDVPAAVERTLARYEACRDAPEKAVWHAVRRAVVSHAMTRPMAAAEPAAMPWAAGAAEALDTSAAELVEAAPAGLEDRGALRRADGRYDSRCPTSNAGRRPTRPGRPRERPQPGGDQSALAAPSRKISNPGCWVK
jgi:hypothetical protein